MCQWPLGELTALPRPSSWIRRNWIRRKGIEERKEGKGGEEGERGK